MNAPSPRGSQPGSARGGTPPQGRLAPSRSPEAWSHAAGGRKEAIIRTRSGVRLQVGFGPAATPTLAVAVALARAHADDLLQTGSRSWVVTFRLGTDEARYGRAT